MIQPRLHDPHADIGAVYRQRALIPAAFYLWLMAWVAFTLIHMVQRIKQQQDQMHYMALHDALSGLPNRTQLAESLKAMLATHQAQEGSFAIVMLDLDRFKTINDTLGHQVGDALICAVAQRLRQTLREGDVAARVGGDEFVLLLAHVDYKTCLPLCQRVAQALNAPFQLAGRAVHIGASLGVAIFPGHGKECEALMRYADLAMYAIKMRGGGIQLYSEEIDCIKTSALQKGVTLETLSPT